MVQLAGDIEEEYERLTAEGVTFRHSPRSPQSVLGPDGRSRGPDGVTWLDDNR
jgi:hypothetical protein